MLITYEPIEFENKRLKFQTLGKSLHIWEEYVEYTSN